MNEATYQLPPQMSTLAPGVDDLYYVIYWASVISFLAIVGVMVYFVWKYRRRDGVKPEPTGHSTSLEIAWTFLPLIFLGYLFHVGFDRYMDAVVAPGDSIEIRVRGMQWNWEFEHANGGKDYNKLYVPVGQPVRLIMGSSDVLHSLFIPVFRVKRDLVPGMYTTLWFEATQTTSVFPANAETDQPVDLYCAEYCGAPVGITDSAGDNTNHSTMRALVHVIPADQYPAYTASLNGPPPSCAGLETESECWGEALYSELGCVGCHQVDGTTTAAGPNWGGMFGTERSLEGGGTASYDENYIRESIVQPQAKIAEGFSAVNMPPYNPGDAKIDALIAYIRTLGE